MFLDRLSLPSEEEQAELLGEIARTRRAPSDRRTLDAGADKPLPAVPMEPEANPFLGQRGDPVVARAPGAVRAQLRAILRVATEHPLKLMFPMVATEAELEQALTLLARAREETGVDAAIETGIMVEVPAAARLSESGWHAP